MSLTFSLKIKVLLFLVLGMNIYGQYQPIFEPDPYSIFQETNFRIKMKIKIKSEGSRYLVLSGSDSGYQIVERKEARPGEVITFVQKKLTTELPRSATAYKLDCIFEINRIDSTKFYLDTTKSLLPCFLHKYLDSMNRLEKLVRIMCNGDTFDILTFQYDSINRISQCTRCNCRECGLPMRLDSLTNIYVPSGYQRCEDCADNRIKFQYESDSRGRIKRKHVESVEYGTTTVTEILNIYGFLGRRQINLWDINNESRGYDDYENTAHLTSVPLLIGLFRRDLPKYVSRYTVIRFDRKNRPQSYRYYFEGKKTVTKKYRYYRK